MFQIKGFFNFAEFSPIKEFDARSHEFRGKFGNIWSLRAGLLGISLLDGAAKKVRKGQQQNKAEGSKHKFSVLCRQARSLIRIGHF